MYVLCMDVSGAGDNDLKFDAEWTGVGSSTGSCPGYDVGSSPTSAMTKGLGAARGGRHICNVNFR